MDLFNSIVYLIGSITTVISIVLCLVLFFRCKSRDENGNRIELDSASPEPPWPLGLWIAGVERSLNWESARFYILAAAAVLVFLMLIIFL